VTVPQAIAVTSAAKKILEEALALSQQEREELVSALSSSLDPIELSPEWSSEIDRRIQKIERGEAEFLDAKEHLSKLRQKHTD
jgi:putative addiction module component (TIGR02574 family)